jgi:hypothetical protein
LTADFINDIIKAENVKQIIRNAKLDKHIYEMGCGL